MDKVSHHTNRHHSCQLDGRPIFLSGASRPIVGRIESGARLTVGAAPCDSSGPCAVTVSPTGGLTDPRYVAEPKLDGRHAQIDVANHRPVHVFSRSAQVTQAPWDGVTNGGAPAGRIRGARWRSGRRRWPCRAAVRWKARRRQSLMRVELLPEYLFEHRREPIPAQRRSPHRDHRALAAIVVSRRLVAL